VGGHFARRAASFVFSPPDRSSQIHAAPAYFTPLHGPLYASFSGGYVFGALLATIEQRRLEKHLLPTVILARARAQSCAAFTRGFHGTLILLVRVDDLQSDLRTGLDESTAEVPAPSQTRDRIAFSTALDPEEVHGTPSTPPEPFDHLELRKRLLGTSYFALPIKKREVGAKPFAGKVSVGRARNNDIVLRHPTVSKMHAWFEIDAGRVFVGDARSKNRTWIGTELVRVGELSLAPPGSELRFGRVAALLVSADALWRAAIDDDR